jgi:hypothetical protein
MARGRRTFRQSDLTAALKATEAAPHFRGRIVIDQHGVTVIPGEPGPNPVPDRNPIPDAADPDIDPETLAYDEAIRNAKG